MSIPLVEIKVDTIDPKLLQSTLMARSWPLFEKCSTLPDTQRSWVTYLVSPCGGF